MRTPAVLLVVLALLPAVRAQDEAGESLEARLLRDQSRVGQRLTSLREKLERLAARYDDEGRTRNAALLREAMTRFDEQQLLDVQREVQRGLEQGSLSTVERQDALVAGLEAVYAILRDRRDVEELSRQASLSREGLAQLAVLAENQRRLLASTRATTDTPKDLLEQALSSAEELARKLADAEQAARLGHQVDQQLGESELAAQMAREQRALAAEPAPDAASQALLQEALALLREHLQQPGVQAGEESLAPELLAAAEAARTRAQEAAADAAAEMQDAHAALTAAARGQPAPPAAAADGEPRDGAPSAGEPQAGEPQAGEPQAGERESAAPGEATPGAPAPSGTSGATPEGAAPKPGEPPREDSPALAAARERMERAAARLDEVRDELERSERSLSAARNRARAAAQAQAEEAGTGGQKLDELAQRLEAVEPQAGPEMLDRTRELMEELLRLQQAVEAEQLGVAGERAASARASLDRLLEMLKQRLAGAAETAAPTPGQEQLDGLASQQAELERQVAELMRRLSELPDQGFQEPAARAQQAMQGAERALQAGDAQEGATREAEAAEQLEQTKQELSGESRRYERLRQEEVLFRLKEDLTAMLDQQKELTAETTELQAARGEDERLTRSQRRAAGRMAEQERDLSAEAEAIRAALAEDQAVIFEHALDQTRADLLAVADKLADEQTGWDVQMLQADVEQRLSDLLAVLDAERERRREALEKPDASPPGGGGSQGDEPLVPTVAELLLIQRLEQAALARLDAFASSVPPDGEELDEGARDLLQRWASEHQRVTELFREKFRGVGGPAGEAPHEAHPTPEEGPK